MASTGTRSLLYYSLNNFITLPVRVKMKFNEDFVLGLDIGCTEGFADS